MAEGVLESQGSAHAARVLQSQPYALERAGGAEGRMAASVWDLDDRLGWLAGFSAAVEVHADELAAAVCADCGKSSWEAFAADVLPLLACARWTAANAPRILASRPVRGKPWWLVGQRHWTHRVPLGSVALIATWNYPVQLLGIQLVQAIVAGNRVTVKPSEHSPRSQGLLLRLAADGLPADVLRRTPATREAGADLLVRESFDHVVFTGSTEVGRQIAVGCASSLTPTTLELSGCDSAIVLQGADLALAARTIWQALSMNAGQTCMAPRRILVDAAVQRPFLAALAPLVAGAAPRALISEVAARQVDACVREAVASGGHSLSGVVEAPEGRRVRPAIVSGCSPQCRLSRGDHFGPAAAVLAAHGLDALVALHRSFPQHLAVSFFAPPAQARALAHDRAFVASLGAGFVTFHDAVLPTVHPATSIRGRGLSGWGASRGEDGLIAMTRTVTVSQTSVSRRIPAGEPQGLTRRLLRAMLR